MWKHAIGRDSLNGPAGASPPPLCLLQLNRALVGPRPRSPEELAASSSLGWRLSRPASEDSPDELEAAILAGIELPGAEVAAAGPPLAMLPDDASLPEQIAAVEGSMLACDTTADEELGVELGLEEEGAAAPTAGRRGALSGREGGAGEGGAIFVGMPPLCAVALLTAMLQPSLHVYRRLLIPSLLWYHGRGSDRGGFAG